MTLETIVFEAAKCRVEISLYGGQILSWRTADGVERLYVPDSLQIESGRALRGGVPICFPQFSDRGPIMKHGFARLLPWRKTAVSKNSITLALSDNVYTRKVWNYAFTVEQTITLLGNSLCIDFCVKNTDHKPFDFTTALHTYFRVENIYDVQLQGLQGLNYEDALQNFSVKTDEESYLKINQELDRVYHDASSSLKLLQPQKKILLIEQQSFTDTVVWNPGPTKVEALMDMPNEDWQKMLCVEAAIAKSGLQLLPGQSWVGFQRISILD